MIINTAGLGNEGLHINGHFFMYVALTIGYYKATKSKLAAFLLSIMFALSDELHQVYVPGRSAGFFDVFTDAAGAALAVLILWKFYRFLPNKLKNWLSK
jgi:VanZ family protein